MVSASDTDKDFTISKAGGEKMAPVDLTEMYALWANRGTDFINTRSDCHWYRHQWSDSERELPSSLHRLC